MKILLISDTHLKTSGKSFPEVFHSELVKADFIIHAGDFIHESIYEELLEYAPLKAVYGNVDSESLCKRLPDKDIFTIGEVKIGLTHGHLGIGKSTPERALRTFEREKPDIIIFGHSHIPHQEMVDGVLLYNPGSVTAKRFQKQYSYGWLTINETYKIETHYF
ncbi:metallophosphoesterase family protein [Alkalihalobacillus sp. TS-13]|uniref:metallophosphoesterase family protein n=1 Tax=Alkalihalobacillus sp. TS-13 TaxID=2842455 RepID=UPI001C8706CD|nr:metallophosphoesterase family protein [Alkalihalobacillus sp. TS-13]